MRRIRSLLFLALALPLMAMAADQPPQLEPLPEAPPPPAGVDLEGADEPQVTIVKKGADTIEEYRIGGEMYMMKITPDHASAHNNLGRVLAEEGRMKEALQHFFEAVKANPNYKEAHFNLAGAYAALEKHAEAAAEYEMVLRLDPGYRPAVQELARSRRELEKPRKP